MLFSNRLHVLRNGCHKPWLNLKILPKIANLTFLVQFLITIARSLGRFRWSALERLYLDSKALSHKDGKVRWDPILSLDALIIPQHLSMSVARVDLTFGGAEHSIGYYPFCFYSQGLGQGPSAVFQSVLTARIARMALVTLHRF